MQVKANDGKGPFLFDWDPETDQIEIIRKDMLYRVQLMRTKAGATYRMLEERKKPKCSA